MPYFYMASAKLSINEGLASKDEVKILRDSIKPFIGLL